MGQRDPIIRKPWHWSGERAGCSQSPCLPSPLCSAGLDKVCFLTASPESAVWGNVSLKCGKAIWTCLSNVIFIITVARSILNSPSWWCAVISISKCKPLPGHWVQQIRCRFGTVLWEGCPTGQMLLSGCGPASSLI